MRVLMMGRTELLESGGGDKVQVENTAKALRALGVEVDISTKIIDDLSKYDLVHVFQLDWTPETYFYVKHAKSQNKKVVLSPIHHSLVEVEKYDREYAFGIRRVSKLLFKDQHARDTFKNVYRSLFDLRKMGPTVKSIFLGLKNMHKKTLELSDVVLVQTEAEARDLINTYEVKISWVKIPNGVGDKFVHTTELKNRFDFNDYVVCVGRIEPRKNQLNIISAVSKLREKLNKDIKLVLVGVKSTKKHLEFIYYFNQILKKNPWVVHVPQVPYEEIPSIYKYAKVCVSASWFETTGLTSLEALFCGTNAVASGERAREYLGENGTYCIPHNIDSIEQALEKEYLAPRPVINSDMIKEYTWENAGRKTLEVYKGLLNHTGEVK